MSQKEIGRLSGVTRKRLAGCRKVTHHIVKETELSIASFTFVFFVKKNALHPGWNNCWQGNGVSIGKTNLVGH